MGLCPDCRTEGETVTYIGASRADIVNGVNSGDQQEGEMSPVEGADDVSTADCDLCGDEYVIEKDEEKG